MPIRGDALKVKKSMQDQYGEKWEEVFYATAKKQGRNPETWEKIEESLTVEDVILGRLATTIISESDINDRVVIGSCRKIIAEAVSRLTEAQKNEMTLVAAIFEEFYQHNLGQIKAALSIVDEPGVKRWGERAHKDWKSMSTDQRAAKILGSISSEAKAKAREAIDSAHGASQSLEDSKKANGGTPLTYDVDDAGLVKDNIVRIFRDDLLNRTDLL